MTSIEIAAAATMAGRERGPQSNACALHLRIVRGPSRAHAVQIGWTAHSNHRRTGDDKRQDHREIEWPLRREGRHRAVRHGRQSVPEIREWLRPPPLRLIRKQAVLRRDPRKGRVSGGHASSGARQRADGVTLGGTPFSVAHPRATQPRLARRSARLLREFDGHISRRGVETCSLVIWLSGSVSNQPYTFGLNVSRLIRTRVIP
jgi:hypothetical protein